MAKKKDSEKAFIRKKVGRPVKLSRELIKKVCDLIRIGTYVESACIVCGIHKTTFYEYMKKANAKPKSIYGEFKNAVLTASEEATVRDLMVIEKAVQGQQGKLLRDEDGQVRFDSYGRPQYEELPIPPNWTAAAWRLERRKPKEWGRGMEREIPPTDPSEEKNIEKDNKFVIEFVDC